MMDFSRRSMIFFWTSWICSYFFHENPGFFLWNSMDFSWESWIFDEKFMKIMDFSLKTDVLTGIGPALCKNRFTFRWNRFTFRRNHATFCKNRAEFASFRRNHSTFHENRADFALFRRNHSTFVSLTLDFDGCGCHEQPYTVEPRLGLRFYGIRTPWAAVYRRTAPGTPLLRYTDAMRSRIP